MHRYLVLQLVKLLAIATPNRVAYILRDTDEDIYAIIHGHSNCNGNQEMKNDSNREQEILTDAVADAEFV